MNFFEHQDRARRSTGKLVALFVLAVVLIVIAVNLAAAGLLRMAANAQAYSKDAAPVLRGDVEYPDRLTPVRQVWREPMTYVIVTICTLLLIGGGSLYKTLALSSGGPAVAEMLGGRPVSPNTRDPAERTLLNVVEEMSIGSGVPAPAVYVLHAEKGINAFAAGFSQSDSVIGVTRGALEHFNRDELQGVIAHEFSHILHGDTRINLRLIGIVHGILVIALIGYFLLRSVGTMRWSSRDSKGAAGSVVALLLMGGAMVAIGYVGMFCGRLIHAAVSRQREFLADASAVQFTRNPHGIAGALKKLGGGGSVRSYVQNVHAQETAHMFFGLGVPISFASLLATHPPLEERIRAIDPTFTGVIPPSPPPLRHSAPQTAGAIASGFGGGGGAVSDDLIERVGTPTGQDIAYAGQLLRELPERIVAAAHEPFSARVIIYCLLAEERGEPRQRQLAALEQLADPATYQEMLRLLPQVDLLGRSARLPLLDLALPALRQLSPTQLNHFQLTCKRMIEADQHVTLFEYALYRIIRGYLRPPDHRARRQVVQFHAIQGVADEARVLLAAVAAAGRHPATEAFEAGRRRLELNVAMPPTPPSVAEVDAALTRLNAASPGVKRRLIDALAHCVTADQSIEPEEAELLRAIATTLDCPLPPLLAALTPAPVG